MYKAEYYRIFVKSFCVLIFIQSVYQPIATTSIEVDASDSNLFEWRNRSYERNYYNVYSDRIEYNQDTIDLVEGSSFIGKNVALDSSLDYLMYFSVFLSWFLGILFISISLIANLFNTEFEYLKKRGIYNSKITFAGFMCLVTNLLILWINFMILLPKQQRIDITGGSFYLRYHSSQNNIFILNILALLILLILPFITKSSQPNSILEQEFR